MMSFLLPAFTIALVALGSFCLFMAIEQDRNRRNAYARRNARPFEANSGFGARAAQSEVR